MPETQLNPANQPMSAPAGKRYLVTGAAGFLGRHLAEQLALRQPQDQLLPLLRDPDSWQTRGWGEGLHNSGPPVSGGLLDLEQWQSQLPDLDGIFHLAAVVHHSRRHPEPVYEANVVGTLNMVRLAAAKGCRLVYVSTSGTVGVFDAPSQSADEHAEYQQAAVLHWPYYDSKLQAEKAARSLAAELGVELVIIRPPMLLGPGDHRFRSTGNIIRYLRRKLPFLINGGIHFIDIRDAAAAIIAAMRLPEPQAVYHLAGEACSIGRFFEMVELASGVKPPAFYLPHALALGIAKTASLLAGLGGKDSPLPDPVVIEMAGKYWGLHSRYAATELGFHNRPGQETINDTVQWLMAHHPKLQA